MKSYVKMICLTSLVGVQLYAADLAYKGEPNAEDGKVLKYEGIGILDGRHPAGYTGLLSARWGSDKESPEAGKTYLVGTDYAATYGAGGSETFPAKLTLGAKNGGAWATGTLLPAASSTMTFGGDGLVIENGRFCFNELAVGSSAAINGKISIGSDGVNDVAELQIRYSFRLQTTVNADMISSADAALKAYSYGNWNPFREGGYSYFKFLGDLSGFYGTLNLGSYANAMFGANSDMPGTLKFSAVTARMNYWNAPVVGSLNVGNLVFSSTNDVYVGITALDHSSIRVDGAVTVPASAQAGTEAGPAGRRELPHFRAYRTGKPKLNVWPVASICTVSNTVPRHVAVLDVPAGSPSVFSLFSVNHAAPASLGENGDCAALVGLEETVEDGRRRLYVDIPKSTYALVNGGQDGALFTAAGNDGWFGGVKGVPQDAETAYFAPTYSYLPHGTWTFHGKTLLVRPQCYLVAYGISTVNDLRLMAGSFLELGSSYTLYGNVSICDYPSSLDANGVPSYPVWIINANDAENVIGDIASDLHGDGFMYIGAPAWDTFKTRGQTFRLRGDNSSFGGFIGIAHRYHSTAGVRSVVCVDRAENLGGPMTKGFHHRAIAIDGGGVLKVLGTFALTEETRGIRISARGAISIPDATNTFTIGTQTTYCGELIKEGEGTLALQGACRFSDSQSETPSAANNKVTVAAGRVMALSKAATDGLAITFAAGTGLKLPSPLTASMEAAQYGFYDKKWLTPFDLSSCGGRLSVEFDQADISDWPRSFELAVCTVPSTAADELTGKISVVPPRGYVSRLLMRENADDETVTFYTVNDKAGFSIIVW